ncbi:uncharacterized protein LOC6639973 [Drosophila willistoni]|uniref:uncharacterized protein LOC6639973 n=1 Tax=Drosophila willistoni TaxID=7260 RepID=UPI001F07212E|nr:uncharacterized protein LOC6639973 [Drosophila willistoni]
MLRYLLIFILLKSAFCGEPALLTQTVYGFLDFTTTIGNTVMVFSPQSSPQLELNANKSSNHLNIIETKPHPNKKDKDKDGIQPTPLNSNLINNQPKTFSSKFQNVSITSSPIETFANIPEYDLLSRQPEEYAEETYRVINLKSKADPDRQRNFLSRRDSHGHPTGFITKISEVYTSNGLPTVRETSVLGTYISGKYAQVLQSASATNPERKSKVRPSNANRTTKTVTPSIQPNRSIKETSSQVHGFTKTHRKNSQSNRETAEKPRTSSRKSSRNKGKRRHKTTQNSKITITPSVIETNSRRSFRTKTATILAEEPTTPSQGTFKLNRRPGRWQYKSSPKPKVNIRKTSNTTATSNTSQNDTAKPEDDITEINADSENQINKMIGLGRDLEASGSQNGAVANNNNNEDVKKNFVQTLNVEISTPQNFVDTYYEIATIKSPFIFQAGVVKKTRFITVTSTIEKVIKDDHTEPYAEDDGPLTENILESSTQSREKALDGSVTTLKPLYWGDTSETPVLETITESFSITQTKLKTQILPIIFEKSNETIEVTLVQTYDYTSLITVTQTISPLGDNFNPSKNFKDFEGNLDEAGSELNLDLEFGDDGNLDKFDDKIKGKNKVDVKNLTNIQVQDSILSPEKNSLPLVNFLSQPNNVQTVTRPVLKLETLWESHVVPLVRGSDTILRTLSKSVGVVEKTEYVTEVSTVSLPPLQTSQYPFSINPFYNPLLPIPQQQLITSTEIVQTTVTETSSKILKLTFGARTAYTTIFSTGIVPTSVTKIITATVPMQQPGSGFPNYYPPPYPPFAYVG